MEIVSLQQIHKPVNQHPQCKSLIEKKRKKERGRRLKKRKETKSDFKLFLMMVVFSVEEIMAARQQI